MILLKICFIIFAIPALMLLIATISVALSGEYKDAVYPLLGLTITTAIYVPIAVYLGFMDIMGLKAIFSMNMRMFVILPSYIMVITLSTIAPAAKYYLSR